MELKITYKEKLLIIEGEVREAELCPLISNDSFDITDIKHVGKTAVNLLDDEEYSEVVKICVDTAKGMGWTPPDNWSEDYIAKKMELQEERLCRIGVKSGLEMKDRLDKFKEDYLTKESYARWREIQSAPAHKNDYWLAPSKVYSPNILERRLNVDRSSRKKMN